MREISQLLSIYCDPDRPHGSTPEERTAYWARLWEELVESDTGQKLLEIYPDGLERTMEIFEIRHGSAAVATIAVYESCEEIMRDLITAAPKPTPAAPPPPPPLSLVDQVRRDMTDPNVPTSVVREKRRESVAYERAFQQVNQPIESPDVRPVIDGKLEQFAHRLNETLRTRGASALRANAGQVTLEQNGREYVHPYSEFQDLFEKATAAGLIR